MKLEKKNSREQGVSLMKKMKLSPTREVVQLSKP
jgi:hypothetical protein